MLRNRWSKEEITEKEYFNNLFKSLKDNWENLLEENDIVEPHKLENDDEIDEECIKHTKLSIIKEWADYDDDYEYTGNDDINPDYDEAYEEYISKAIKELIENE